jgi:hypothetical protein
MTGLSAAALAFLLAAAPPLPYSVRVDGARAVERARYAFVVNATKPFDEVYPRSVFEKKVQRETAEEKVLLREFGMSVTPELLAGEYDRIEKESQAPDQWQAMKKALGNDRRRVEQVVCRPLLVERALRRRYAFDPAIHQKEHQKARAAREAFLAGNSLPDAKTLRIARGGAAALPAGEMLKQAKAESKGTKALPREEPAGDPVDRPIPVDPEMAKVLEKELKSKGDVTTILEERDRFSVFRLVAISTDEWLVEGVQVPKTDFEAWFERAARKKAS